MLRQRLTYLPPQRLANLEKAIRRVEADSIPGDILELGVALGGSGITLARSMGLHRAFKGYDVFGMIPPTSERDDEIAEQRYEVIRSGRSPGIGGDEYYGYRKDLLAEVAASFDRFGVPVDGRRVVLQRGLFENTLNFPEGQAVALAHIDSDWYDSVLVCLERVYPALSPGGFIVVDDYFDYEGCRRAVDAFMRRVGDMTIVGSQGNLILRRQPPV